jgi:hypothetical protein
MPQQLRRIGAASCAKILAVLYGILGVIMGVAFSLIILVGALAGGSPELTPGMPAMRGQLTFLFAVASIVFFPIFYAVIGAVFGLIGASLYNFVASRMGGIEIEIG